MSEEVEYRDERFEDWYGDNADMLKDEYIELCHEDFMRYVKQVYKDTYYD